MSVADLLVRQMRGGSPILPILFNGEESPVLLLREKLGKFHGGFVNLTYYNNEIAVVTLNQPSKKNAISGKMMGDLFDVVDQLEKWEGGKGVILQGAEGNFCSGGDLDLARGTNNAEGGFEMATFMGQLLTRFQALPFITVALIEGCGALGGGAEICTACDYRLIAHSSRGIGFVHGKMGIIPAWGGTGRLVQIIGYSKALRVLASAQVYRPQEALKMGLVDEIIPSEVNPSEFAKNWIKQTSTVSSNVLRGIKTTALLTQNDSNTDDLERRIFSPYWGCDENKSALNANIKHK